jgi:glutathione S-transferase
MITLWGRQDSTNVIKVLWLSEVLGIAFDRKDVGGPFGGLDSKAFLTLNPNGVIPVIEDGDTVVWESHSVLRFLAQKYGPDELYPTDPHARSHVERWLDWHISTLSPVLTPVFIALFRTPPERQDRAEIKRMLDRLTPAIRTLDAELGIRPYIAGERLSIADIAFGNSIWRWFAFPVDRPRFLNLEAWQARIAITPGYAKYVAQRFT